ncbi:MAG: DUF3343 domain-containing protein [Lachnospiraceae bacterium]|nr:DUF3343 domain-containing protein [Lachnospiraceae bacterium]
MTYIATFFTHFGAIEFKRACASRAWEARLSPVPRSLSSSCGTCVIFKTDDVPSPVDATEDTEQIVRDEDGVYTVLYRAEGS